MKPALAIAIASSRRVFLEFAICLAHLDIPINTSKVTIYTQPEVKEIDGKLVRKIMPTDEARNWLTEKAREIADPNGYIFFLDDDVLIPRDTIPKLVYELEQRPDYSAIAGVYFSKTEPPVPTIALHGGAGPYWQWKVGDVFECPMVATGCLLIRLNVFDKLPRPWFKTIRTQAEAIEFGFAQPSNNPIETPTSTHVVSDDYFWCTRMQQAGFKILAHGGVLPLHIDDRGVAYGLPPGSLPTQPRVVIESPA